MNRIREQLRDALTVSSFDAERKCTAHFCLSGEFVGFQGHFPGRPVLPGVCMLAAALVAVQDALGVTVHMEKVSSAKFFSPVLPDDKVRMEIQVDSVSTPAQIRVRLDKPEGRVAKLSFTIRQS